MNRGLKSYTKQLTQELGNGCTASVNVNKNDANLHISLPLLKTVGLSPITTSLIFNYQDRNTNGKFGKGVKLNLFSKIEQIFDGIRVHNADGSFDDYVSKDKYYNKETQCTAKYYAPEYHTLDEWVIEDKYGNKRTYYPPTDYPQAIEAKNGDIFNIDFMSIEKTVKNKHGDLIKFLCETGDKITKVVYFHNDTKCASAALMYNGDNLTRVTHYNENDKVLSETDISYTADAIIITDTVTTFALKYVIANGCIVNIISGYGNAFERKKEINIAYFDNKTSISDPNGKVTHIIFDSNSLPLYIMDSDGNVTETEYDGVTKEITSQSNVISTKKVTGNLFPNIGAFKKSGVTVTEEKCTDPFFKEILGETVYKVSGNGELSCKINTNGIATDNITAVIWGKQLTACTDDSYVSATLSAGDSDHDKFKKEKVDDNFDLMTLGVENKSFFPYIELVIFLRGNASIILGGIQVLKKNFGSFYNYDGKGNVNEIGSNGSSTSVSYDAANMPSQIVGADASVYSCEYDNKGNVKKVIMAHGVTQNNEYDKYNHLVKSTITNSDETKKLITEKTYSEDGRFLTSEKDELGNVVAQYNYDVYGKVISVIDAIGAKTEYNYHQNGLIKDILLKNGTAELLKAGYTYYDNRLIKSVTLKNGSRYDFTYDSCNNLTQIKLNGIVIFAYEYDATSGKLVKQLNGANGDGFMFNYDETTSLLTEVCYCSDNGSQSSRFKYTYDDKGRLATVVDEHNKLIRELKYDVDGNVVKEINANGYINYSYDNLGAINNKEQCVKGIKNYQSFDPVSRSTGTNPQSLRAMFASDENYIGLFSKDANLIGKTKGLAPFKHDGTAADLQLKNLGLVSCALVDDSHTLSYMPNSPLGSGYASGCIQYWFKPKNKSGSKLQCLFNIKGYDNDSISVYLQNGKLILKTINRSNKTETLLTSAHNILEQQWNFFALSFINRTDEGTVGVTEYALVLNGHVQHYKKNPMIYNVDVGGDTLYNLGHRYDGSKVKEAFNGYITCVNMSARWYENPSEILKFYNLSKEYFVALNADDNISNFGVTTRYKYTYENLFDIYPLHNSVVSLNGKRPVAFSIRNKSQMDKDRSFAFNSQTFRYAYVADGSLLTYELGQYNTGTIMMRAIADECNCEQYLFEAKDSQDRILGLFRDANGKLCVNCNGTVTDTNLAFSAGEWHTVGLSLGSLVTVFLDGQTFVFSKSVSYQNLSVTIGRKISAESIVSDLGIYSNCYPLNGQIEMLCLCPAYSSKVTMGKMMDEMKCSTKATLYDIFGRNKGTYLFADNGMTLMKGINYKQNGQNESKQVSLEAFMSSGEFATMRFYDYDIAGRVNQIRDMTFENHQYEYDKRGYLTKADGVDFTYDSNGNIKSVGSTAFEYDSVIKDRLVKVGNTEIKYDSTNPLNPTKYGDRGFGYEGRRLVKYTIDAREGEYYSVPSKTYEYKYNEQGLRIQKIAPEGTTNYVYDGNNLITELAPNYRLDFLYDENGLLYGFIKDDADIYYYVKDYLQNILGIVDINGKLIVKYNQTAYGVVTIALDTNDIGKINPFRYKGYYYDQESGMYYCHTRYYVPEWGRWLNIETIRSINHHNVKRINLFSCAYENVNVSIDTVEIDSRFPSVEGGNASVTRLPLFGHVEMAHQSEYLIGGTIGTLFFDITHTVTVQTQNQNTFYSFADIGLDDSKWGLGFNFGNWYGYNAYVTSNIGIGQEVQITPWLTLGREISKKGVSFSIGIQNGNVNDSLTVSIGWGTIIAVAATVALCVFAPQIGVAVAAFLAAAAPAFS